MNTGSGAADAKAIELIEIDHAISFATKREQKEKLEQEEKALRQTVEENPKSRRARLELAKFLFHQNKYTESKELALSVLEIDETNANAFCLLGRIFGFGKPQNVKESESYFQKALKSDSTYAKAHYFYAYLLRSRLERYSEAEQHYKSAMKLRPDDVTSYNDCAIMLVRQNRSTEAKELYEKVLQLQPDHAIAHFNLANLLRKDLKNYKEAEKFCDFAYIFVCHLVTSTVKNIMLIFVYYVHRHFLTSIQKRPKFTAALNNYATMLHHQLKRYEEAERYYLKALQIDVKYSRAHFNYANLCREHLKKYEFAQEHYLRAIMHDCTNPNFYNNYGLLLQYALKKYKKAKKQYEIALKLDDLHALGHCNYGTILMQMVDKKYNKYYDESNDDFYDDDEEENSEEHDPYFDNDELMNENGKNCNIPQGEYDDFVLNGGYKNDHKNNVNGDEKESVLDEERLSVYAAKYKSIKKEYFSKSEWHFKKSIALNRSLVMAYNNYGCLLRRLEQQDAAKQMFAKALSIDPKFLMAKRNLDRAHNKERGIVDGNGNGNGSHQNMQNIKSSNQRLINENAYANGKLDDGGCLVM